MPEAEDRGTATKRLRDESDESVEDDGQNSKEQKTVEHAVPRRVTARALLRHKASLGWHRWRCLQKYLHIPPGEEMAILYMKFFPTSGKGYVGQHRHGA